MDELSSKEYRIEVIKKEEINTKTKERRKQNNIGEIKIERQIASSKNQGIIKLGKIMSSKIIGKSNAKMQKARSKESNRMRKRNEKKRNNKKTEERRQKKQ